MNIHKDTATLHHAARILLEAGHHEVADKVEAIWRLRMEREVQESLQAAFEAR